MALNEKSRDHKCYFNLSSEGMLSVIYHEFLQNILEQSIWSEVVDKQIIQ